MGFFIDVETGCLKFSRSTPPAGSNTQVQFNDAGQFGAEAGFEYNKTTNSLKVVNLVDGSSVRVMDVSQRKFYDSSNVLSCDVGSRILYDSSGIWPYVDWGNQGLWSTINNGGPVLLWSAGVDIFDSANTQTASLSGRYLIDSSSNTVFDWGNGYWYAPNYIVSAIDLYDWKIYATFGLSIDWDYGALYSSSSYESVNYNLGYLYSPAFYNGGLMVDFDYGGLFNPNVSGYTLDWINCKTFDLSGANSVFWDARELIDGSGQTSVYWSSRQLVNSSLATLLSWSGNAAVIGGSSSTSDGALWYDTTQKTLKKYEAGVAQGSEGVLFTQIATGTCVNTVTETTITSTGVGTLTLPANFFVAGKSLRFVSRGIHSATASPTLRIRVKLGSTTVLDTGAITTGNSTDEGFTLIGVFTCRTTGASGTIMAGGAYQEASGTSARDFSMSNTGTVTINTTTSQAFSITATWGTANAANSISIQNLFLEVLN